MALKAPIIQEGVATEVACPPVPEGADAARGFVFDIQKFSVHDGPGIRTLVLFKGCPLRCSWCCNPESQTSGTQVVFFSRKCIRQNGHDCRECLATCPNGAIELLPDGAARLDRQRCEACGGCVATCPASAFVSVGQWMTVEQVFAQVEQDAVFYRNSGGGVTLSGGEPAMQPDFATALLRLCKSAGLHTALETCGHAPWESIARLLPYLDLALYDVKHMDPEAHQALTGVSNRLILDNARRIAESGIPIAVRVPVIPGHNDSEANIRATAAFARELGATRLHLLPYHRMGAAKYQRLQIAYRLDELRAPDAARMRALCEIVQSYGIDAQVGG